MKNGIPFMIELTNGKYMVTNVRFKSGRTATLKYRWLCRAEQQKFYCFRTSGDARLAAKHNGWAYMGKV